MAFRHLALALLGGGMGALQAAETVPLPLAAGFDLPVAQGGAKSYYRARGYQPNGHLGEDWNGAGGGDTDLGDPVYTCAEGVVVFARDYHLGWGNVVMVRHAFVEEGAIHYADSLYGHLDQILVTEGAMVKRGQQIGTIGNNHGMYPAHLHFELRKNLAIGLNRNAFARDFSNYYDPTLFIEAHRELARGGEIAQVPVHTFEAQASAPPLYAGPVSAPVQTVKVTALARPSAKPAPSGASSPRGPFVIDRYSDLRGGR